MEQTLTTTELLEYLKTVVNLEKRLYEQNVLENTLSDRFRVFTQNLQKETTHYSILLEDVLVLAVYVFVGAVLGALTSWVLSLFIALFSLINDSVKIFYNLILFQHGVSYIMFFVILGAVLTVIIGLVATKIDRKYITEMEKSIDNSHLNDRKIAVTRFQDELIKLSNYRKKTADLLYKLYDFGILDSKYRNLIAVCTFYEYLSSGKCTQLYGNNGVITLYESEILNHRINVQLDNVLKDMESIKEHQKELYSILSKTNLILHQIVDDMDSLINSQDYSAAMNNGLEALSQYNTSTLVSQTLDIGYYQQLSSKW